MTAFAIMCHGEPERLSCLLNALAGSEVYIHIDKFSNREAILSGIQKNNLSKVTIIAKEESLGGAWGGYSLVEIQLILIKKFLSRVDNDGPLVFLSGQDYPIKPIKDFLKYLTTGEDFFSIQKLDKAKIDSGELSENARADRLRKLHFQDLRLFYKCKDKLAVRYKLGSIPSALLRRMKIPNAKFNSNREYFIGSQWVAISRSMCHLLVENCDLLKSEFRFTFCPDELAFQTFYGRLKYSTLNNFSKNSIFFDSIIDANFHVIHPSLDYNWSLSDFDSLMSANKFFIRKPSWELLMKLQNFLLNY